MMVGVVFMTLVVENAKFMKIGLIFVKSPLLSVCSELRKNKPTISPVSAVLSKLSQYMVQEAKKLSALRRSYA